MNILLLTEAYPPAPMVGSHRAAKVARAFSEAGHRVHVLTTHGGSSDVREDNGRIVVEQLTQGRSPRELYNVMKARFARDRENPDTVSGSAPAPDLERTPRPGFVRRAMTGILWLPDDQQSYIPAAVRASRTLARHSTVDLIYSTAPAFSVHLAAGLVQWTLGCKWVAEFRDPWTDNAAERLAAGTAITRAVDRALERAVLNRASAIVTNSERAADLFRRKVGSEKARNVFCALNGIQEIRTERASATGDTLRLVYAGNLYPPRDPFPLLTVLRDLKRRTAVNVEVVMVGHCTQFGDIDVRAELRRLDMGDFVKILPYMPAADAQSIVNTADLLLLPAQGWTHQIPNKLFDYLGSRVPILAIVEPESEAAAMLARAGGHFVTTTDGLNQLERTAESALHAAMQRNVAGCGQTLEQWAVRPQMTALVHRIEQLTTAP